MIDPLGLTEQLFCSSKSVERIDKISLVGCFSLHSKKTNSSQKWYILCKIPKNS